MRTKTILIAAAMAGILLGGSPAYPRQGTDDPGGRVSGEPAAGTDDHGRRHGGHGTDDAPASGTSGTGQAGDDRDGTMLTQGDGGGNPTRLRARLADDRPGPVETKVSYKVKAGLREFKLNLKMRLPDTSTGVTRSTARDASIVATLSASGTPFAVCDLAFDRFLRGARAEYGVTVAERSRGGKIVLRQNKGGCDIDLAQTGIQAGVPKMQSGDEIILYFHPDSPSSGTEPVELGRGRM